MSAYNSTLGDRLPQAEALNDKRRRNIKRLLSELKEPTVEAVENYFSAFSRTAKPFYFGENDTAGVPALTTCCVPTRWLKRGRVHCELNS
jgi:hypothetical protein